MPLPMPRLGSCRVVLIHCPIRKACHPVAMTAVCVIATSSSRSSFMITIPANWPSRPSTAATATSTSAAFATSIGEFVEERRTRPVPRRQITTGDFAIAEIRPSTYNANGRMVIEIRALLGGMTLSNIDALSRDEARRLSPQEVDPIDEEAQTAAPTATTAPKAARREEGAVRATRWSIPRRSAANRRLHPLKASADADDGDATLFGALWPLGVSSSSMPPWIGVCCVSSATASVISATSSLRCPRTGISPGSDSTAAPAAFHHPPGFLPGGANSVSFQEIVVQLASRFAHRSPVLRSVTRCRMIRFAPSRPPSSRTPARKPLRAVQLHPTAAVLTELRKEGVPAVHGVPDPRATRDRHRYTKHMLRLRHASQISGRGERNHPCSIRTTAPAATRCWRACSASSARTVWCAATRFADVRVPHEGNVTDHVIEGAYEVLHGFERVLDSRDAMRVITLDDGEARSLRQIGADLKLRRFLAGICPSRRPRSRPRRSTTTAPIWVGLQPNPGEPGQRRPGRPRAANGRQQRTRPVQGIDQNVPAQPGAVAARGWFAPAQSLTHKRIVSMRHGPLFSLMGESPGKQGCAARRIFAAVNHPA